MPLYDLEDDHILYETDKRRVAWITMNKPAKLNALTHASYKRIAEYVHEAEQDEQVKVIVFRGADGVFTSGQDVDEAYGFYFRRGENERKRPSMARRLTTLDGNLWGKTGMTEVVFYCLKPTISMVQSRCFGAGMDLLMASDMAICSDDTLFGHPGFTYHGFGGDLASYIHHMGIKRAKEFTLTSRAFDADEAYKRGLVNAVVPASELAKAIDELIDDVLKMPMDALVMQKQHYRVVLDGLGMATNFSAAMQALAFGSNIKYEEGDNIMVRDREKGGGAGAAIQARKQHYGHF